MTEEGKNLSDAVMSELLTLPDEGETILTSWSHYTLSGSPDGTLGHGEADDLTPPEVNARTVYLANTPHDAADYLIVGRLGEGGMGVVFEAEQVYFKRRVALKMIRPELAADAHAIRAFFREAVITSKLDHPGIVSILDFGTSQDARAFYAMKRVNGTPWSKVLHDKPLDENLDILDRVAAIVAYAHSQNVLHRDIKPANVMLGEFGEMWLGDWGVAVKRNAGGDFSHARPDGTPQYMAPESATCRFAEVGVRSDVYLLGAMLFEILDGCPPHSGKTQAECLLNAAENDIRKSKANDPLVAVAMQAMETLPHRRYASAADFQKALHACRAGRKSSALIQEGDQFLLRAKEHGGYESFTKAIAVFDEAIAIEPQNIEARAKRSKTIFAYSKAAQEKNEYDLAASVLEGLSGNRQAAKLLQENERAKKRAARRKRNSRAAAMGGVAVLLIAGGVAFWYNRYVNARYAMTIENTRQERMIADEYYLVQELVNSYRLVVNCASMPEIYRMRPPPRRSGYQESLDACAPSVKHLAEFLNEIWPSNSFPSVRDLVACHRFCRSIAQRRGDWAEIMAEIKSDAEKAPPDYSRNLLDLVRRIEHTMRFVDGYRRKYMDINAND